MSHLEALVLENTLNRRILTTRRKFGLENDTERAVADNFTLRVLNLASFAGLSILDLLGDNLRACADRKSVFGRPKPEEATDN